MGRSIGNEKAVGKNTSDKTIVGTGIIGGSVSKMLTQQKRVEAWRRRAIAWNRLHRHPHRGVEGVRSERHER